MQNFRNCATAKLMALLLVFSLVFSLLSANVFAYDIPENNVNDNAIVDYITNDSKEIIDDEDIIESKVTDDKEMTSDDEYYKYKPNNQAEITKYAVIIYFEEEYLFIERGSEYDLLYGVSATDEHGVDVPVFVLDDGGFDVNSEWPNNSFVITYTAIHPITEKQFTAQRTAFVTESIAALGAPIPVYTFAQLTTALNTTNAPNGSTVIIELMDNIEATGVITIAANRNLDITLRSGPGGPFMLERISGTARHFALSANSGSTLRLENITLSGNYPTLSGNHGGVTVNAGGRLIMEAGSTITNNHAANGAGVQVTAGGRLYMEDGSAITNNHATGNGAGVQINGENTRFTMNGGEINGNLVPLTVSGGVGGVFVENSALFIMNGGTIRYNEGRLGGGVRIGTGTATTPPPTATRMYMYGGDIYGNIGSLGGGINVERGTFTMEYGTIRNNTATGFNNAGTSAQVDRGGGGVFIQNGGSFNMLSGEISGNRTHPHGHGGGVMVHHSSTIVEDVITRSAFNMHGGTIYYNRTANNGGGVQVNRNATGAANAGVFNMFGGLIDNNRAGNNGGGVWFAGSGTVAAPIGVFNMHNGAIIRNNRASASGGGVFLDNEAVLNMNVGSEISGNRADGTLAANGGGGVFLQHANSRFNMHGGTIHTNRAQTGGGVRVTNGIFTMNAGIIDDNHSYSDGGGIWLGNGTATANARFDMAGGTISNNNAVDYGGGIFTVPADMINILNIPAAAVFTGNTANRIYVNTTLANSVHGHIQPGTVSVESWWEWNSTPSSVTVVFAERKHAITNYDINSSTGEDIFGVTFSTTGHGTVTAETIGPADTRATVINKMRVLGGTAVEFTASPSERFENWDGDASGTALTWATTINADTDVIGNFEYIYHTVTFDLAGGTGISPLTVQVRDAETATRPVTDPTRVGYSFDDWNWDFTDPVTAHTTITAQWDDSYHTVTFNLAGGTGGGSPLNIQVRDGETATRPATDPTRVGYSFDNWDWNFTDPITAPTIITALWDDLYHTITFNLSGGAGISPLIIQVRDGAAAIAPSNPTRNGYSFIGWYLSGVEYDFTAAVTEDITLVAQWNALPGTPAGGGGRPAPDPGPYWSISHGNTGVDGVDVIAPIVLPYLRFTEERIAYISGFPDGTVRPSQEITRAEIAMMLFRLIESNTKHLLQADRFSDVQENAWYAQAVNYLANQNILAGYADGTFRPAAHITRAELAAVMSRFSELYGNGISSFSDVTPGHWAFEYINNAHNRGWVTGYEDGTFRPNNATSRAEAVTIINRVLHRVPNSSAIRRNLDGISVFTDITTTHWAYYEILEAAITREFELGDGELEIWTSFILPNQN